MHDPWGHLPEPPKVDSMQDESILAKSYQCSRADEIIARLHARGWEAPATGPCPYRWAYRGQADARWKLTSTALRPGTILGFHPDRRQYVSTGNGSSMEQMNCELLAIKQFAELADRVGLPIPGFHPLFRQDGFDFYTGDTAAVGGQIGTAEWPKTEMLELMAIAQHHGVPTRLLDFSYDPLVALFFAADDIVRNRELHEPNGVTDLAVWGVDTHQIHKYDLQFRVVEVERATNPFLKAQKGLFILDRRIHDFTSDEVTPSLDERIESTCRPKGDDPVMIKLTMPIREANNALDILALQGIDRPHLMPTFDNVVASLKA